jgi:hypothetical protein
MATWLVERLSSKDGNEVLAGDLLELFNQGRSNAWYWRQVLVVILLVIIKERRVLALAAVVTIGWALPLNFWDTPIARIIYSSGTGRSRLVTLIHASASLSSLAILPTCFAFGMYVAMRASNSFTVQSARKIWRRWLLAQLASCLTVATSTSLFMAFLPAQLQPIVVVNVIGLLPVFLGILVMIWASPCDNIDKGIPDAPQPIDLADRPTSNSQPIQEHVRGACSRPIIG